MPTTALCLRRRFAYDGALPTTALCLRRRFAYDGALPTTVRTQKLQASESLRRRPPFLPATAIADATSSVYGPEFYQNICQQRPVGLKVRRIGIVPICHIHQSACAGLFLHRLDDIETATIKEKRVIAKQVPEFGITG
jgi:hypothetical protein